MSHYKSLYQISRQLILEYDLMYHNLSLNIKKDIDNSYKDRFDLYFNPIGGPRIINSKALYLPFIYKNCRVNFIFLPKEDPHVP